MNQTTNQTKNSSHRPWSRREFVAGMTGATMASATWAAKAHHKDSDSPSRVEVCIFSKHLQWLGYKEMATTAAGIGFDGIDLTVRPGGHVLPERVERDLPRAVEAATAAGIRVATMTTAITDPADPKTETILKTASKLGIRSYRLGYYRYEDSKDILETLRSVKLQLRELAKLNQRYRICGDYQNHAGSHYVGAPLWDLWEVTRDIDPEWIGCQFDIRHATVEGGSSWPVDFRILSSRIHTVVAKDFRWEKTDSGWRAENCPLAEGMVNFTQFFRMLAETKFTGPLSLHFEYPLGGANRGARQLSIDKSRVIESMRRDLGVLKDWLAVADLI